MSDKNGKKQVKTDPKDITYLLHIRHTQSNGRAVVKHFLQGPSYFNIIKDNQVNQAVEENPLNAFDPFVY